MEFLKRKEVIFLLRLIVGATFVYAAWDKVINPRAFAIAVRGYQIVPVSVSNLFALALAWSEMVAGVLLILGLFTRQAAGAILLMLAMFTAALSTVMIKGLVIDCGCFQSEGGSRVGPLLLVRNVLLIAACVWIMRYDGGHLSLGRVVPSRG